MLGLMMNKKGQAATEIAIIGSVLILVFSYLITFTVRLNKKQFYLQKAFRTALAEAKTTGTATALITAYLHMPNIMDPYTPGEISGFGGGGAVLWSATGQGSDSEIKQESGSASESGTYTKTLNRTESEGGLPVTRLSVNGKQMFP